MKLNRILNVPKDGLMARIGSLKEIDEELAARIPEISLNEVPDYELDFMLLLADDNEDLKAKCNGLRYAKYDSTIWVILPKTSGPEECEVIDPESRKLMNDCNVTIVKQVALNNEWEAFRLRPFERVEKYNLAVS